MQKIRPGDLTGVVCESGSVEESVEDFQGAFADREAWLDVLLWWIFRGCDCNLGFWRVCCAFGLGFDLGIWFSPTGLRLGLSNS